MAYEVKVVLNLEDNVKKKLEKVLQDFKQLERTLSKVANTFNKITKSYDNLASSFDNLNKIMSFTQNKVSSVSKSAQSIADRLSRTSQEIDKTSSSLQAFTNILKKNENVVGNVNTAYEQFISNLKEFWDRFGAVAVAFTILYRLFNLIENAISSATDRIIQGIQYFDDYTSAINRYALMLKLAVNNALSFSQALKLATDTINAVRLASLNALTGFQEVITGLDELAQQGIYISSALAKPFTDFVDLTVMIAQTTGSTLLQVRQELSALMTGSARASNQMVRFLKNLGMTDKQIKDLYNKLLSLDNPSKRFAQLIIYLDKYISQFKDNLFNLNFDRAVNRFSNLINILSSFSIQLVNLQRTGKAFSNVFAKIFNDLYQRFINVDIYKKINKLQLQMYQAIIDGNLTTAKALFDKIQKLQAQLFTPEAKTYIKDMAHLYNLLADALKGVVAVLGAVISFLLKVIRYIDIVYQVIKKLVSILYDANPVLKIFVSILGQVLSTVLPLATAMFILYKSVRLATNALIAFYTLGATRLLPLLTRIRTAIAGIGAVLSAEFLPVIAGLLTVVGGIYGALKITGKWEGVKDKIVSGLREIKNEIAELFGFGEKDINKLFGKGDFKSLVEALESGRENFEAIINSYKDLIGKYKSVISQLQTLGVDKVSYTAILPPPSTFEKFKAFMSNIKKVAKDTFDLGTINVIPKLSIVIDKYKLLQDAINKTEQAIKRLIKGFVDGKVDLKEFKFELYDLVLQLYSLKKQLILSKLGFDKLLMKIEDFKASINNLKVDNLDNVINQFKSLNSKIKQVLNELAGKDYLSNEYLKLKKKFKSLSQSLASGLRSVIDTLRTQFKDFKTKGVFDEKEFNKLLIDIILVQKAISKLKNTPLESLSNKLQMQLNILKQNIINWRITISLVNEFRNKIDELKQKLKELSDNFNKGIKLSVSYQELINARNTLAQLIQEAENGKYAKLKIFDVKDIKQAKRLLDEYDRKIKEIQEQTKGGQAFFDVFKKYSDRMYLQIKMTKQFAQTALQTINAFEQQTANILYDAFTGRLRTFKDYANALSNALLQILSQVIAKMIVAKTISAIVASANGNVLKGGIKFFANGGIVREPTIGVVGEGKYNEAIVPLPDGRHIPAIVKAPQQQPVHNNIVLQIQAIDAQSIVEFERRTGAISGIVREAITKDMQNNGMIRRSIKSYF